MAVFQFAILSAGTFPPLNTSLVGLNVTRLPDNPSPSTPCPCPSGTIFASWSGLRDRSALMRSNPTRCDRFLSIFSHLL
jgi:hypothetical protein